MAPVGWTVTGQSDLSLFYDLTAAGTGKSFHLHGWDEMQAGFADG